MPEICASPHSYVNKFDHWSLYNLGAIDNENLSRFLETTTSWSWEKWNLQTRTTFNKVDQFVFETFCDSILHRCSRSHDALKPGVVFCSDLYLVEACSCISWASLPMPWIPRYCKSSSRKQCRPVCRRWQSLRNVCCRVRRYDRGRTIYHCLFGKRHNSNWKLFSDRWPAECPGRFRWSSGKSSC